MTKVILGDNISQIDGLSGRRYGGNVPGRVFDVTPEDARAIVKLGGAMASESGTTRRSLGYRCGDCGFGSFVVTCSRCGGTCARE